MEVLLKSVHFEMKNNETLGSIREMWLIYIYIDSHLVPSVICHIPCYILDANQGPIVLTREYNVSSVCELQPRVGKSMST